MILLIDAGNTQLKYCPWEPGQLGETQRIRYEQLQFNNEDYSQALISCVAHSQKQELLKQHLEQKNIPMQWLKSPSHGLGILNSYTTPSNWGVDRWLALAAAYADCAQTCCVIDVGTAITVDICDASGQHLGGHIAPGLQALQRALRSNTDLPAISPEHHRERQNWLAQDTEMALYLGALHSACGLIERSLRLAKEQHGCEHFYLTGGDSQVLQSYLPTDMRFQADLVFQGLSLYAKELYTSAPDSV